MAINGSIAMPKITINELIAPVYDEMLFDILDHKHTHYVATGGRGGLKSSFFSLSIILLITSPENKNVHAVIFRKVANTLRDSVYSQMCFAIELLQMTHLFSFKVSPMEITYLKTGQKILFRGLDAPEKIKSIKAPFGYFGITWFEELDSFHGRAEIRSVLQSTMRGKDGRFWAFESFNPPISAANWCNKDLLTIDPDRLIIKTDYRDVPVEWLSQQFFDEAEKLKAVNERAYNHEYLGIPTGTGGNVFENVTIREITGDEIDTFNYFYYGLDFGYFPDCAAFVGVSYNPNQRKLYIFTELKRYKTSNLELAELLNEYINCQIIADSAEPKSISDFKSYGFNMRGCEKGAGSVEYSIKWLQSLTEIVIDNVRCPNATEEFLNYEYERTKDGEIISGYPDKNNHFIDSCRYALNSIWRKRGQ